jgi:hypothetical protein
MTITVKHTTPADGSFSPAGATAWNADHALAGLGTMAEQNANNVSITGGSISGVSGLGNAQTSAPLSQFAATTSAQLASVISDETGSGALVFANSPVLVTPALGTPSALVLTNATGLPLASGVSGTLPVANGGTGTTTPGIVAGNSISVSGTWPNQTVAVVSSNRSFIDGLAPAWISATTLGVTAGACYIESLGISLYGAPVNITPSSPSASTWYHVYVYSNAGTLTLEASTTAPVAFASPLGTARSKSGDTSRRYLYSALTKADGTFYRWAYGEASRIWQWVDAALTSTPFTVLSGGATTATAVDCSAVVPVTAQVARIRATASGGILNLSTNDAPVTATTFAFQLPNGVTQYLDCPCDASQRLSYRISAGTATINVSGFYLAR